MTNGCHGFVADRTIAIGLRDAEGTHWEERGFLVGARGARTAARESRPAVDRCLERAGPGLGTVRPAIETACV
jgi:hypothetical protein